MALRSQALTLFTTPVVYLYLDRLNTYVGRGRVPRAELAPAAEPSAGE
jgi:hypothetical protein